MLKMRYQNIKWGRGRGLVRHSHNSSRAPQSLLDSHGCLRCDSLQNVGKIGYRRTAVTLHSLKVRAARAEVRLSSALLIILPVTASSTAGADIHNPPSLDPALTTVSPR